MGGIIAKKVGWEAIYFVVFILTSHQALILASRYESEHTDISYSTKLLVRNEKVELSVSYH
jgi:hypothetical protein